MAQPDLFSVVCCLYLQRIHKSSLNLKLNVFDSQRVSQVKREIQNPVKLKAFFPEVITMIS
uniref:Uncharacterized protein n=1 Tax=Anguilla anguilla TaxID=7936 RepID=A0A0E9TIN9_ANGAN